jgi:phage gp29-like protein
MPGLVDRALKPFTWTARASREAREAAAWLEGTNPLRGMTIGRAQAIFDASRRGDTVELQWLYNEIEAADPTLMVCAERRAGALVALDWQIAVRSAKRVPGYDQALADDQSAALEAVYGRADAGNLTAAIERLAMAFFRGFAHVAPLFTPDGLSVTGFDILDGWNFVRDIATGAWYWNPNGRAYGGRDSLSEIPASELCSVVRSRHIDYPALAIYLRNAVGERAWGQFIERYGIPPVIITMPPDIPADSADTYKAAAETVAEGASGALPNGSQVFYAEGARGTDPFSGFLEHQQKLVVLMATGGMLTSLAEAGSGTLAGGAHEQTWREVWRKDSAIIADALNRTVTRQILDRAFPGRPHLAYWKLDTEPTPTPGEVFDDAAKAVLAGYRVDRTQLEEKTGYRLTDAPVPATQAPAFAPSAPATVPNAAGVSCNSTKLHCNSTVANAAPQDMGPAAGPLNAILEAFSADYGPLAKKVAALADLPDAERPAAAQSLIDSLADLAPADPQLASMLETDLAETFITGLTPKL